MIAGLAVTGEQTPKRCWTESAGTSRLRSVHDQRLLATSWKPARAGKPKKSRSTHKRGGESLSVSQIGVRQAGVVGGSRSKFRRPAFERPAGSSWTAAPSQRQEQPRSAYRRPGPEVRFPVGHVLPRARGHSGGVMLSRLEGGKSRSTIGERRPSARRENKRASAMPPPHTCTQEKSLLIPRSKRNEIGYSLEIVPRNAVLYLNELLLSLL